MNKPQTQAPNPQPSQPGQSSNNPQIDPNKAAAALSLATTISNGLLPQQPQQTQQQPNAQGIEQKIDSKVDELKSFIEQTLNARR